MRTRLTAVLVTFAAVASLLDAQHWIAQPAGIPNPQQVVTFGANLYPNFTTVTTQFPGLTLGHCKYFTTGVSNNLVGGFLTNDFNAGPPHTLSIAFAGPISDLSFVYHQIGSGQASVFRAMLAGSVVDSFSHLWNQSAPNNYFGFTNVVFDELQIDFVVDFNVDTLAYNGIASCTTRNGSGINPVEFACVTTPVVGGTWQAVIGTNPNTLNTIIAVGLGGPHPGFPLLGGEVLIQLSPEPALIESFGFFAVPIPNLTFLIGLPVATQGVRIETVGPAAVIVPLNAIDLVLGL